MINQPIPLGSHNICLEYKHQEYICLQSNTAGSRFYVNGSEETTHITNISSAQFTETLSAIIDPTAVLVDDLYNAYYKVLYYNIQTTVRPTRS